MYDTYLVFIGISWFQHNIHYTHGFLNEMLLIASLRGHAYLSKKLSGMVLQPKPNGDSWEVDECNELIGVS